MAASTEVVVVEIEAVVVTPAVVPAAAVEIEAVVPAAAVV